MKNLIFGRGSQGLHHKEKKTQKGKTEISENTERKIHNFEEDYRRRGNWTTGQNPGSDNLPCTEKSSEELFRHLPIFPELTDRANENFFVIKADKEKEEGGPFFS